MPPRNSRQATASTHGHRFQDYCLRNSLAEHSGCSTHAWTDGPADHSLHTIRRHRGHTWNHDPLLQFPTSVRPTGACRFVPARGTQHVYPPLDDRPAWSRLIGDRQAELVGYMTERLGPLIDRAPYRGGPGHRRGARLLHTGRNHGRRCRVPALFLDIHGGALVTGGGVACKLTGAARALAVNMPVWAIDYRMPPEHPYPAALDDCLAVYQAAAEVRAPSQVFVGGTSAGGNLAAALLVRARDEGLPMPAGVALMTPELDLTESGDCSSPTMGSTTSWGRCCR